jgi:integrase
LQKLEKITEEQWMSCNEFNRNLRNEFIENSTELSPKTKASYFSNLTIWINYIREFCENKKHIEIKPIEFMRFQNWMINRGCSSSDVSNKRAAVSSLNNYIVVYYHDDYPTFHNFINKSIRKPPPSPVHEKLPPNKTEMEMLLKELESREEWQYIAYLKFTYETGCRRAESRQILKSIESAESITKIIKMRDENGVEEERESKYYLTHKVRCKGRGTIGKVRTFKFSDYSMDAIKKWVQSRGEDDCEYLFVTKYYGAIKQCSESTFNQWMSRIFSPILGRRFTPHALRSSRATIGVVEDGRSIESLQKLLGHESATTTKIYVCKQDEDDESDELFVE